MPPTDRPLTACTYLDKGGTGKTTTLAHLAVVLANTGSDVVVIDLAGKQGDLAKQFGLTDRIAAADDWPNIATVFQPEWTDIVAKYDEKFDTDPTTELIYETGEGPDLIPAHHGLDALEAELDNKYDDARKFTRLSSFFTTHLMDRYDAILVDLPGVANNITYNGIFATEHVITPVQAGAFESEQADALKDDLAMIRDRHDQPATLSLLVPNMIDTRTTLADHYLETYADRFSDALAPKPIPRSQDIANAQDDGHTIFEIEDPSATAQRAIDAYEANTDALVQRIQGAPA